jgi:hypothetical protein
MRTTSIFPLASMRSLFATFLLSFCIAALATPVRLGAQQPSACAERSAFPDLHERFERLIASEDSANVVFRRNYHLPQLPPDSVLVVTDERICERAARAYYRNYIGPRPLLGVEVLRVGDIYIVYGAKRGGEWAALEFLSLLRARDRDWTRWPTHPSVIS